MLLKSKRNREILTKFIKEEGDFTEVTYNYYYKHNLTYVIIESSRTIKYTLYTKKSIKYLNFT
jgi:hypothetical protein